MVEDFGPYRIERKMAVGGMAEIFLARHRGLEGLERTVVLKQILPKYVGDPEFVTMFLDEARLMAALSHPNIAQVLDLGKVDRSYYLVMEYVRGPTLKSLLSAASRAGYSGLPEKPALGIALAVAEALDYVHQLCDDLGRPLNIVHRDLNPANVLLSYDGAVKLIDFGIAKAATKVYETRTGVIKGTYGYIAPEQLTKTTPVDHRADVFALGVLMYEMLVGKHPFDTSDEPNLIDRILNAAYKRPRQVVPTFPKPLDKLVARCLSPHPEGRPENVRTVIVEVAEYLAQSQVVPTMGDIAYLVREVLPDQDAPVQLRPLTDSHVHQRPFGGEPSHTINLRKVLGGELDAQAPIRVEAPNLADLLDNDTAATIDVSSRVGHHPLVDTDLDSDESTTVNAPAVADMPTAISAPAAELPDVPPTARQPRPQRRRRRPSALARILLAAASIVLVVGVGVGAFVVARALGNRGGDEPSDFANAPIVEEDPPEPSVPDEPPEAEGLLLHVTSEPAGAAISVDGVAQDAVTPASVEVAADADTVWLRVSLDGHVTQEREVLATAGEARFVLASIVVDAGAAAEPDAAAATKRPRRRPPRRRRPRMR